MPDRYELRFDVTRDDIIAAAEAIARSPAFWSATDIQHRRALRRQVLWMAPLIIPGAALFIGRGSSTRGMYLEGAFAGLLLAALMYFGLPRLDQTARLKKAHLAAIRKADWSNHVGPTTVIVDDQGVHIRAPARELRLTWPALSLHDLDQYILIAHGAGDGTFIPKRCFASPGETTDFIDHAWPWWHSGQLPAPERLARYLADRDTPCPGCKYNLRDNRTGICPECGRELTLDALAKKT